MAERRSLGVAMEMTPAKLAFIQGQTANETKPVAVEAPAAKATVDKTIELETPTPEGDTSKESRPRVARRSSRGRSNQDNPDASEILDQVLVPVTIRLQHRLAQALRRAYLEQRLKHAKPDTQQEIVDEALGDWLTRQGFLE